VQKTNLVETKTADFTVTAQDSGKIYVIGAVDLTATLPATASGLEYTFVVKTVSVTTGFSVSPAAVDNINGGTDNKDLINSSATDVAGDCVKIVGDGSGGWWTIAQIGSSRCVSHFPCRGAHSLGSPDDLLRP
jgi:hypothetical protein